MADFLPQLRRAAAVAAWLVVFAVGGCGGGGSNTSSGGGGSPVAITSPPASIAAMVGIDGGTVNGPDGVQVVIPAGALDRPTEIGIARSAVGAPALLPEDYTATSATPIYEFTPHDLVFNMPVTIRVPTASTAPRAQALMASPGADWQATDAFVSNGFAQWQRNSFSWGLVPACAPINSAPYSSSNPDPYPCSIPSGSASASATPTSAITRVMANNIDVFAGTAGSWTVNQASTVRLTINYQAAPDCQNPRAKLLRWNPAVPQGTPGRVQTLFDGPVALTPTNLTNPYAIGGGTYLRGTGNTSQDVPFSHLDNGTSAFAYTFSCNRPSRSVHTGGDLLTFIATIPLPSVTYTIGGAVSGLAGAGLVLQNNRGGNLAVPANGAFSFATAVAAGAPYAVTVLTQPAGQTCSVQNGSGTASANVGNVAVSCAAVVAGAKAWQGASLLETLDVGEALEPRIAFDTQGNAMASWHQVSSIGGNYKPYARRYSPGAGWGAVAQIPTDPLWNNAYSTPQIAFAPSGNAVAVFSGCTSDGCGIWTARFTAATAIWATATQLVADVGGDPQPQIATDTAGNALAVWKAWNGRYSDISSSRYDASTNSWQAPRIHSADIGGSDPKIAFDGSGNAIVIWRKMGSNSTVIQEIMGDRYVAGTGWNPQGLPTRIASFEVGASRTHRLAVSSNGEAMVVWTHLTTGEAHESVYARRFTGGNWGTVALVESTPGSAAMPSVAMDASGNAIVSWFEEENSLLNVWARRYTAGVGAAAVRIDALNMQSAGGSLFFSGGGPQVAMDASGNAMVVWNQALFTWANRYVAATGWAGATQITSPASGGSFSSPEVAVDASGNAIAVWTHPVITQTGVARPDIWSNLFR